MRLVLLALLLGCTDDSLAGVGQPCNSSGDCAAGLLCDFSKKQHTCQPAGPAHPDLSVPDDLAGADARIGD